MLRSLWIVVTTLLLISCTTPSQTGIDYLDAGNKQAAYDTWLACAQQGDSYCMNNVGMMYQNGHMAAGRDTVKAINWLTLAARYGNPTAQQNLITLGAPVPAADLQQQSGGGGDAAAAMLLMGSAFMVGTQSVTPTPPAVQPRVQLPQPSMQSSGQPQRSTPVNCTSTVIGSQIHTNCY